MDDGRLGSITVFPKDAAMGLSSIVPQMAIGVGDEFLSPNPLEREERGWVGMGG